jgi:serine/threonine protein kinase
MTSREGEPAEPDWGDFESADTFPRPFGTYILLQAFARGGMGEVYLAKSGGIAGLEKYCVLKKLRPELTSDREYVQRFIDEARVVVQLNHANVAQVFDVGRVGPEYYLAMEYVSGRDLRTMQDRARDMDIPLPIGTILHLVCEVLEALDYAHRRKHPLSGEDLHLVHRDVSPQNVLISFEGEVKLIDFGLAQSRMKKEATSPNIVMGKMAYMAPEQARGDNIDRRADLFAAGVMLYEFIVGERFYEGMSAHEIWQVVGRGGFRPRMWESIDDDLREVLDKALAPNRDDRYTTCGELEAALSDLLHTNYGGQPSRASLRLLVETLFGDDINREREQLHKFGRVEIKPEEAEASRSLSVSLLALDDDDAAASTFIARDEGPQLDEWGAPVETRSTIEVPDTDFNVSEEHPRVNDEARQLTPPTGTLRTDSTDAIEAQRPPLVPATTIDEPPKSRFMAAMVGVLILLVAGAVGAFVMMQDSGPTATPIKPGPGPINVPPPDAPTNPDPPPDAPPADPIKTRLEEGRLALGNKGYPSRPSTWPADVRTVFEAANGEGTDEERLALADQFATLAKDAGRYRRPVAPRPPPPRPKAVSQDEMIRFITKKCSKPCKKEVLLMKLKVDQNKRLRNAFRRKVKRCYESCK